MKSFTDSIATAVAFDKLVKEIGAITPEEKLLGAFASVRDIPYGGTRSKNPEDVLEQEQGTGRGKHALLASLFASLGYEVKQFLAKHNLATYPISPWPDALASYKGETIPSFHHFLKVKIGGDWRTVDATFDKDLTTFGFPVLEWDGKTDMVLPVVAQEIIEVDGDVAAKAHELIQALSEDERKKRQAFLKTLKQWIESSRTKKEA